MTTQDGTEREGRKKWIVGTTRPIKPEEKEVMTVAAEIVSRRPTQERSQ